MIDSKDRHPLPARKVLDQLGNSKIALTLKLARVFTYWSEVVGNEVASLGRPIGRKKEILCLAATDSAAVQELSFHIPTILEQVNAVLGEEVFFKVYCELRPEISPNLEEKKDFFRSQRRSPKKIEQVLEIPGLSYDKTSSRRLERPQDRFSLKHTVKEHQIWRDKK